MTAQPRLTVRDFIAWEAEQENKHEFAGGVVIDFAGGSLAHGYIASYLIQQIGPAVLPCRTSGSDILLQTERSARYPDVSVTCDERDRQSPTARTIRYPKLIVEVLSESTVAIDRAEKLDEYRSIETLIEYAIIDSRKRWAETYRKSGAQWIVSVPIAGGTLDLESIGVSIDLDRLYEYACVEAAGTP